MLAALAELVNPSSGVVDLMAARKARIRLAPPLACVDGAAWGRTAHAPESGAPPYPPPPRTCAQVMSDLYTEHAGLDGKMSTVHAPHATTERRSTRTIMGLSAVAARVLRAPSPRSPRRALPGRAQVGADG